MQTGEQHAESAARPSGAAGAVGCDMPLAMGRGCGAWSIVFRNLKIT